MVLKKLEIEKHIALNDSKRIEQGLKAIKTKHNLAKMLKRDFPKSKHLYEQLRRLETIPFKSKYNKELVAAVCKVLQVEESVITVEVLENVN